MPSIYKNGAFYGTDQDFDSLDNRPQKDVTSLLDIITPMPVPTHYRGNLGCSPVGTIIAVMGNSAPQNYLACNGQVVNIVDYPELANYFADQFGSANYFGGDGTSTFKIPDLRGEFLRGTGTNSHENQGSGANVGEHQDGTYHFFTDTGGNNVVVTHLSTLSYEDFKLSSDSFFEATEMRRFVASTSSDSSASKYTSRPTNTSVLYCIATKDIYVDARLDFSTTEKVVGTWVDGKPIYQKTFVVTTATVVTNLAGVTIPGFTSEYMNSVQRSIDKLIDVSVANNESNDSVVFYPVRLNKTTGQFIQYDNTNVGYISYQFYAGAVITIQYTKTID
jgi:microcystin-dependent protein